MIAAALFICAFCIIGTPSYATERQKFQFAQKLMYEGHFQEAYRCLLTLHKRNPKDPYILCELGNCCQQNLNDYANSVAEAPKYFEKALKLDPECGLAYLGLARAANTRGDFKTGVEYATKAINAKQPDWYGYTERAGALSNLHRDKEALADIETYIKKKHVHDKQTLMQKATILENLKRYDLALVEYKTILKMAYEDSIVFREVACLKALNKPDQAIQSLSKLINHNKEDDSSFLARARLFESMGRHKEAISDYSMAIDLQPSTTALKERAAAYDKIGRKDLADKDRKEAQRI